MDSTSTPARLALLTVGLVTAAVVVAFPAAADPTSDGSAFIDSLNSAGVGLGNPTDAVALGESVCPMLAEPGQTAADAAATVADAGGMSVGPATMFTGLAISAFCPSVMSSLANGQTPLPLDLFGFGS